METPAPVNLNALKNILAKSKAVMAAVEQQEPSTNNKKSSRRNVNEEYEEPSYQSQPIYDERDEREPEYKTPTLKDYQPSTPQAIMYTTEQVMASKLPPLIKEAMLKNPIPQLQRPPSSFTLEDVQDVVVKPQARKPLTEGAHANDLITVSKSELKSMINEAITQFFTQAYNKNLTEAAIKQTINTLIKEGKINVKKK